VVTFQADGDELDLILHALRRPLPVLATRDLENVLRRYERALIRYKNALLQYAPLGSYRDDQDTPVGGYRNDLEEARNALVAILEQTRITLK
jgi:hypothetical protein